MLAAMTRTARYNAMLVYHIAPRVELPPMARWTSNGLEGMIAVAHSRTDAVHDNAVM